MLDKLKHTFSQTVIYSIGNLSTKIIGLILLPLYVKELSTSDYGVLALLEVSSQVLVAILGLHISKAMMRWLAQEKEPLQRKGIILNTYGSVSMVASAFIVSFLVFKGPLSELYFGSSDFAVYFQVMAFWVAAELINRITLDLIRVHEKSGMFLLIVVAKFVSILAMNILFVAYMQMGVLGVVLSQAIGNGAVTLFTLPFIMKNVKGGKLMPGVFNEMLSYSFPLIFSTISTMVLTMSDRFMIKILGNYSEVGIYSLGHKIASVLNVFVIQSFQLGFLPIGYKMFNKKDAKPFFSKVMTYLVFVLFLVGLGISLFSKEVIVLFAKSNEAYWIAYTVVPIIIFAFVLRGVNYMVSLGLHYVKKTKYNAYILIVAALLNVALNYFLIPFFGIYGAALASVVANGLMVLLFLFYSQKFYYIHYEKNRILKVFITGMAILATGAFIDVRDLGLWYALLLKALLLISFPIVLLLSGFYTREEKRAVSGAWKKWKNTKSLKNNLKTLFNNELKDNEEN